MNIDVVKNTVIVYKKPGKFEESRFEKIHNVSVASSAKGSLIVAKEIADLIKLKQKFPNDLLECIKRTV